MSKASKQRAKDMRQKKKRSAKEAQKAKYAEFKDRGINQKSKRAKANKVKLVKTKDHPLGKCGNAGCGKCFPQVEAKHGKKAA